MNIDKIMTTQVICAAEDTPARAIAETMSKCDLRAMPVVRNRKPIGIVTDHDLITRVLAERLEPDSTTAVQIMSGEIETIRAESRIETAVDLFAQKELERLLVVDGQGYLVGLLHKGDLAGYV